MSALLLLGCRSPSPLPIQTRPEQSLETQCDQAVLRGLEWIHKFIDDDETFAVIGMDGFYIYHELSLTSENHSLRKRAKALALNDARRIYDNLNKKVELDAHDCIKAWDLLAEVYLLGLDPEPLLSKARRSLRLLNSGERIFGIHRTSLKEADDAGLYAILMDAYTIEKAAAVFPGEAWPDFGLGQVLQFIRNNKELRSPASEAFEEDAFLATHTAYVLTNYGRLRLQPESSEWITGYLRKHFHAVLQNEDIELVAEFIDVFRSLGQDERTDPMIHQGTEFLLRTQHSDGSWGDWESAESYYDAMHFTWCAVMGLRRRSFMESTPYEKRIRRISAALK